MILSAGFGKRLNPLTLSIPKPLLQMGRKSLLVNTINLIKKFGIKEIIINVHYLSDQVINHIKDNKFKLKIIVINEKNKILNTGGAILNAINHLNKEPFFVINPDTIWQTNHLLDMKKMEDKFKQNHCKGLLLVVNKERSFDKSLRGDFHLYKNKIENQGAKKEYIYTGIQILAPEAFDGFQDEIFSINKVWNKLILDNMLLGEESKEEFYHVTNLDIYNKLLKIFPNEAN